MDNLSVMAAGADVDLVLAGEPMGKAGAYGIQGSAAQFVRRIDGCYNSVVGFPLHSFCAHLAPLLTEL